MTSTESETSHVSTQEQATTGAPANFVSTQEMTTGAGMNHASTYEHTDEATESSAPPITDEPNPGTVDPTESPSTPCRMSSLGRERGSSVSSGVSYHGHDELVMTPPRYR